MGTNYYVAKNLCECCNRYDEEYHIGKSSGGWAFTFQGYPAERLVSWAAWKEFLKHQIIMDEYGERKDYHGFVHLVETFKSPDYVNQNGRKNLTHKDFDKPAWLDPNDYWEDSAGYSFTSREFS